MTAPALSGAQNRRLRALAHPLSPVVHTGRKGVTPELAAQIEQAITGRPGIIYFEDYFQRTDGSAGDHIDFWDGSRVMNDRLDYNGPGEREPGEGPSSSRWFRNIRRELLFLQIPA